MPEVTHRTYNPRDLNDLSWTGRKFCCHDHYRWFIDERYDALMRDRERWLNA